MLGYKNDQQPHYWCHLMTLGVQVRLLIFWHEYVATGVNQAYGASF